MTTRLTVTLPDHVYKRIERLAQLSGQEVEEALANTLTELLPPLNSELDTRSVASLSDNEIILLSESMMDEMQSARMSALLSKQQAESMSDSERAELKMLMENYEAGQLRKAQALAEAVKRGLREPLIP